MDPIACPRCGPELEPVAAIVEDKQLEQMLRHLGEEAELPKTNPARAPPLPIELEDTQVDPQVEEHEGIDEPAEVVSWTSA